MSSSLETVKLGEFFLDRFDRLARLRVACLMAEDHPAVRLLDHALDSTYRDCARLGLGSQARELVQWLLEP